MRSSAVFAGIFVILACGIGSAQQTDVSVSAIGIFTNSVAGNGLEESATASGGGLFSFRHFGQQHNGVEVNYAYTKNSQRYNDLSGASVADVQSSIHELTGAYVFHFTKGSFQPFALAGGGLLIFSPTNSAINSADPSISRQDKPAFLYGVGLDYRVSKKVALRMQYRGLVYEAPDFYGAAVAIHTSTAMQMREPSIGLSYRF
jgi:opacity protein-like surface antigen